MNLVGEKVSHRTFGEGVIISQDGTHVSVKFENKMKPTLFSYPSCFGLYLHLLDPGAEAIVDNILNEHEQEEKLKKEQQYNASFSRVFTKQINEKSTKKIYIGSFASETEFYEKYSRSLTAEVTYLRTNGGKRQRVFEGKLVEIKGGRYIYTFEAEDELSFPEGTQISIWQGKTSIVGIIVECEGFTLIISTGISLGNEVTSLELSAEPWRLIDSLIGRLDEMSKRKSKIVHSLICDGNKCIDYNNNRITTGQAAAVQMSLSQPISFVWGPPGTGKTQTLALIALEHIARGHSVLMLSYSNVSVDGAIMRVHKLSRHLKPGIMVRYGYAKRKDLLEHEYLTSYNLTIQQHPELLHERKRLIEERKKLIRTSQRYVEIGRRLTEIKFQLANEEKRLVSEAQFVATTVSKAVVDKLISDGYFDVVIFDEASMAYIPQIIYSASLAKNHFVCIGDFRQLPPIVQSDSSSILNTDIFQYCGITTAVDLGKNHKWLCMLDEQYRMHPKIASFSSKTMYGGLLRSAKKVEEERRAIRDNIPLAGEAIGLADLSGMMSVCTKTADNSRINVLSAFIAFSLALQATQNHEVGIITPYHAQSRLLHAMSRDIAEQNPNLYPISCATVHQFQGSEKDLIVYDAVDCYRMPYPGMLLTSMANNYANRLFNVALTRAKGKFIGVANVSYMDNKKISKGLMFEKLLEEHRSEKSCLKGKDLVAVKSGISGTDMTLYDGYNAHINFVKDVVEARQEIRIDIPNKMKDSSFVQKLACALKEAKSRGVKVYVRAEKKNALPLPLKAFAIENSFVTNPIVLIDKKVIWYGMPDSDAKFVSEGRTLPTIFYPIIRFVGKHTALSLYGFMEMSRTTDQSNSVALDENDNPITETFSSYVLANKKCTVCGKPMKVQKSRNRKFFLACTAYPLCSQTELVDVDLVQKYFYRHGGYGQLCPRCGRSLEAKLGPYGLYIQCCGYPPHKYKLDEI